VLVPYLRTPVYLRGDEARFAHRAQPTADALEKKLLDLVYPGGASLDDLAAEIVRSGEAPDLASARDVLRTAFARPENPIGVIDLDVDDEYDAILVEQGYGGVYVHTVEMTKRLQGDYRCLLISPEAPLFEDHGVAHVLSLASLRERVPDLNYFSYVHIVRTVVARTRCKLLLIAHRSQSLYLFDLIAKHRTIIYCDGFYDSTFRLATALRFPGGEAMRRRVLEELYFLVGNGDPNFYGLWTTPLCNRYVMMAGYVSLRDARENWCWGAEQTASFRAAFPKLRRPVRFMPPFTEPGLFRPEIVEREKVVLFTTTMHNIEAKGFPELVRAMQKLRTLRVRCVVRQPHKLPPFPRSLAARFTMGGLAKPQMVELYHKVWLNCRTSREESSPVSILEAMICELPQIVSPVVASQIPILEDGKTGFVVDPDDRPGLVRALRTLMGDAALRDEMGRRAFDRYLA
jgi:glycosyltransferase involved in cell wall biosynthesis